MRLLICTALCLLWVSVALSASAQDLSYTLGGHVKGFLFQQVAEPLEIDRAGARLQLALEGGFGDPASLFAAIDFELDNRLFTGKDTPRRGEAFDIFPVEIYIDLALGPVEIRLGKQFIFWGRTDWINPTDVITGWDYFNMANEIEDYRMAPLAARLQWYIVDELKLDLVWAPLFRPSRLPSVAPGQMGGLPVTEMPAALPRPQPRNGEFGVRASHSISAWALDWSISGYKGFEKLPVFSVTPIFDPSAGPAPTGFAWTRHHHPVWMVGMDFSKAIGSFVFKGEGAFKITDDWQGDDPLVRNSRLEYVLGASYTITQDVELGAQYASEWLIHYSRKAERDRLTQIMGSRPAFVARDLTHQASLVLRARFLTDFGVQLVGQFDFTYIDFFALGFVYWEIADGLKAYLGGVGFGGRSDTTPFGRQSSASRAFAEIKYSF